MSDKVKELEGSLGNLPGAAGKLPPALDGTKDSSDGAKKSLEGLDGELKRKPGDLGAAGNAAQDAAGKFHGLGDAALKAGKDLSPDNIGGVAKALGLNADAADREADVIAKLGAAHGDLAARMHQHAAALREDAKAYDGSDESAKKVLDDINALTQDTKEATDVAKAAKSAKQQQGDAAAKAGDQHQAAAGQIESFTNSTDGSTQSTSAFRGGLLDTADAADQLAKNLLKIDPGATGQAQQLQSAAKELRSSSLDAGADVDTTEAKRMVNAQSGASKAAQDAKRDHPGLTAAKDAAGSSGPTADATPHIQNVVPEPPLAADEAPEYAPQGKDPVFKAPVPHHGFVPDEAHHPGAGPAPHVPLGFTPPTEMGSLPQPGGPGVPPPAPDKFLPPVVKLPGVGITGSLDSGGASSPSGGGDEPLPKGEISWPGAFSGQGDPGIQDHMQNPELGAMRDQGAGRGSSGDQARGYGDPSFGEYSQAAKDSASTPSADPSATLGDLLKTSENMSAALKATNGDFGQQTAGLDRAHAAAVAAAQGSGSVGDATRQSEDAIRGGSGAIAGQGKEQEYANSLAHTGAMARQWGGSGQDNYTQAEGAGQTAKELGVDAQKRLNEASTQGDAAYQKEIASQKALLGERQKQTGAMKDQTGAAKDTAGAAKGAGEAIKGAGDHATGATASMEGLDKELKEKKKDFDQAKGAAQGFGQAVGAGGAGGAAGGAAGDLQGSAPAPGTAPAPGVAPAPQGLSSQATPHAQNVAPEPPAAPSAPSNGTKDFYHDLGKQQPQQPQQQVPDLGKLMSFNKGLQEQGKSLNTVATATKGVNTAVGQQNQAMSQGKGAVSAMSNAEAAMGHSAQDATSAVGNMDSTMGQMGNTASQAATNVDSAAQSMDTGWSQSMDSMQENTQQGMQSVSQTAQQGAQQAAQGAQQAAPAMSQAGQAIGKGLDEGMAQGISDNAGAATSAAASVGADAASAAADGAGVESPSWKTRIVGRGLADGVTGGLDDGTAAVVDAGARMGQSAVDGAAKGTNEAAANARWLDDVTRNGIKAGELFGVSIADGVRRSFGVVQASAEQLAHAATERANAVLGQMGHLGVAGSGVATPGGGTPIVTLTPSAAQQGPQQPSTVINHVYLDGQQLRYMVRQEVASNNQAVSRQIAAQRR